jgi:hypothetical protein
MMAQERTPVERGGKVPCVQLRPHPHFLIWKSLVLMRFTAEKGYYDNKRDNR